MTNMVIRKVYHKMILRNTETMYDLNTKIAVFDLYLKVPNLRSNLLACTHITDVTGCQNKMLIVQPTHEQIQFLPHQT